MESKLNAWGEHASTKGFRRITVKFILDKTTTKDQNRLSGIQSLCTQVPP